MKWRREQAGKAVDLAAASVLAGAAGFAAAVLASGSAPALLAALPASAAFALAYGGLRLIADNRPFALAHFDPVTFDPPALDVPAAAVQPGDETVVRLFDPRQLHIARPSAGSPDFAPPVAGRAPDTAGQALSDALADLKRSLR